MTFLCQWCSQDPRCNRLQLTDLLVAPLQHCTKFPLLLGNVKKYTEDEQEKEALSDLIDKVNMSLRKLQCLTTPSFLNTARSRNHVATGLN